MSTVALTDAISRLCGEAGLTPMARTVELCATYVSLLSRWNARMNLTALPLGLVPPDSSLLKLVVEPLCAVPFLGEFKGSWVDLGSGGGSPALPLRAAVAGVGSLAMVEARGRKCAFLREAVRQLGFSGVTVENVRFEELPRVEADLVTFRAVRADREFVDVVLGCLSSTGRVLSFGAAVDDPRLSITRTASLPDGSTLFELTRIG